MIIVPHRHHVHFTLCRHTYRAYVFDPDPEDSDRCVCPRIDQIGYQFEETIPGRSGMIGHLKFKVRIIRGRCKWCRQQDEFPIKLGCVGPS